MTNIMNVNELLNEKEIEVSKCLAWIKALDRISQTDEPSNYNKINENLNDLTTEELHKVFSKVEWLFREQMKNNIVDEFINVAYTKGGKSHGTKISR